MRDFLEHILFGFMCLIPVGIGAGIVGTQVFEKLIIPEDQLKIKKRLGELILKCLGSKSKE